MKSLPLLRVVSLVCILGLSPAFAAPVINATKDDNTPAGARKQVGNHITYTIGVSNAAAPGAGNDATAVTLTDGTPANTTDVSLFTTPIARNDSYSTVGNVQITVPAGNGVLANDNDPDDALNAGSILTASAPVTSIQGGNITMSANGSFIYNPPAGFEGTDTFTYTLTDNDGDPGGHTDTATVSITVAGMIWFVNSTGAAGDGRLTTPFNSMAAFQAVNNGTGNNPAAGDNIFLFENATPYTSGVTLLNNQKLIGQDATATLAATTGLPQPTFGLTYPVTSPGGTLVTITTSAANSNGVTLASGNTLRGFTVGNTTLYDIANTTTATVGTLTISDVTCNGTGGIFRADAGGALAVTIDSASTTSASANAIQLNGATTGSLTVNGSGNFAGVVAADVFINGGSANVTIASSITNISGRSADIQNKTGGTVAFNSGISDTATGIFLNANTGATINFTGGINANTGGSPAFIATGGGTVSATQNNTSIVNTITTTTGDALKVTGTSIGGSGLTFRSIASNGGTGNGITLDTTGSGAFTITGNGAAASGGTIQNKAGADGSSATQGSGIYLNAVGGPVSLTRIDIEGCQNYGIRGITVSGGLTIDNSTVGVTAKNGTNAFNDQEPVTLVPGEMSLRFRNLTGTVNFSNDSFDNGFTRTVFIHNSTPGSTLTLNVTGSTLRESLNNSNGGDPSGGTTDAMFLQAISTATINLNVSSSHFTAYRQFGILTDGEDTATFNIDIGGCDFSNNNTGNANASASLNFGGSGNSGNDVYVKYNVHNNTFRHGSGGTTPINGGAHIVSGGVSGGVKVDGRVISNTIGVTGVPFTGAGNAADALRLFASGNNTATTRISGVNYTRYFVQGNTIQRYGEVGIQFNARQGNSRMDATVLGNTIREPGAPAQGAFGAIWVNAGALAPDTNTVHLTVGSAGNAAEKNTMQDSDPNNSTDVFLDSNTCAGCNSFVNVYQNGSDAAGATLEAKIRDILVDDNNPTLDLLGGFTNASTKMAVLPGPTPTPPPLLLSARFAKSRNNETPRKLSREDLVAAVVSARRHWQATGLSAEQDAALRALKFEITNLPDQRLGEADGNVIRIDENAGGIGWSVNAGSEAGKVDLLTTVMHEMGHALGLPDSYDEHARNSIMYGYLNTGEERLPAHGQALGAIAGNLEGTHFLSTPLNIGDLPAGKTVTITYKVTISSAATSISNQGSVAGGGFTTKVTDDPQTATANDATITPIELPPVVSNVGPLSVNEDAVLTFAAANFTGSYTDPNSDALATVRITSLPTNGTLKLSNVAVTLNQDIPIASIANLTYTPSANYNGSDSFGWNGSDGTLFAASAATVNLTVISVNDAPALNAISNPAAIPEDSGQQTVNLGGISAGPSNESSQTISVTATSGNTALIPDPTVTYTSSNATGSLSYTPVANANGSAIITVTVKDNGGTTNGGVDTFQRTFTVNVTAVNDAPVITGQMPISTAFNTARTITFSDLQVTDVDNTYPNGFVLTVSPGTNYSLAGNTVTPATNFFGTLAVPVKVNDGAAIGALDSNSFQLAMTVNPAVAAITSGAKIQLEPGGGFRISFIGNPGQQYTIQYSPDLSPNSWQLLDYRTADPDGTFFIIDTPPAGTLKRFYRAISP